MKRIKIKGRKEDKEERIRKERKKEKRNNECRSS